MNESHPDTGRPRLVPKTLAEVQSMLEAMTAEEETQLSAEWLALVRGAASPDPWIHGFSLVRRDGDVVIGNAAPG